MMTLSLLVLGLLGFALGWRIGAHLTDRREQRRLAKQYVTTGAGRPTTPETQRAVQEWLDSRTNR